jgi:hypothetical protein
MKTAAGCGNALILGLALLGTAGTTHITAFTGTWVYSAARSEFHPGLPFKSFTLTFTPDGVRHLDLVPAGGQPLKAELPWSNGKEVAVVVKEGAMGNVKAVSKIKGRTFDDTWRENGKVIEKVHGEVSSDGKTLTVTVEGPVQSGGTFHNRVVFDRQ